MKHNVHALYRYWCPQTSCCLVTVCYAHVVFYSANYRVWLCVYGQVLNACSIITTHQMLPKTNKQLLCTLPDLPLALVAAAQPHSTVTQECTVHSYTSAPCRRLRVLVCVLCHALVCLSTERGSRRRSSTSSWLPKWHQGWCSAQFIQYQFLTDNACWVDSGLIFDFWYAT